MAESKVKMKKKGRKKKIALMLGAGGPLGGLEAGALLYLDEMGVEFDVVSGACIGSVIGLSYMAPAKGMSGSEAVKLWCNSSCISDYIYDVLPANYKAFWKDAGIFNSMFEKFVEFMLLANPGWNMNPQTEWQRFWSDLYSMMVISMSPMMTTPLSENISRIPVEALSSLVDFNKLNNLNEGVPEDQHKYVYINAMNVTDKKIEIFDHTQITPEHLMAGSSLYFLTPQTKIDGKWYAEGSYLDSINFQGILEEHEEIDRIVVMNILDGDALIRRPTNLYDAYILSVVLPFISIARDDIKIFDLKYNTEHVVQGGKAVAKKTRKLMTVDFEIPEKDIPKLCEWSHSNFEALKNIGYEAGKKFYEQYKDFLN